SKGAMAYLHLTVKLQPRECFQSQVALRGKDLAKAGLALISTYPDAFLAGKLDVSLRTLARYREELGSARLVAFRDSPDKGRFRVGAAEAPEEAFGVDLRPLVARYDELATRRREIVEASRQAVNDRRALSLLRNRIRCLLPLLANEHCIELAERTLATIDSVRRRKDVDFVRLGLAEAQPAVLALEQALDAQLDKIVHMTTAAPAPVTTGAQLLPTSLPIKIKKDDGNEYLSGFDTDQPAHTSAVDDDIDQSSEDEVEYLSGYSAEEEAADIAAGVVFYDCEPTQSAAFHRVQLPSLERVVRTLPGLLKAKGMEFVRHPALKTDEDIVAAYGQASAHRLGFTQTAIRSLSDRHGRIAFAVAALTVEFNPLVNRPTAYLLGILNRLETSWTIVDLRASWERSARHYGV
ncbi:MAG: helix-turn-helix domain-containing protein, partial [Pseudonocardiaceae bacterium]